MEIVSAIDRDRLAGGTGARFCCWRIKLGHLDAATFDAALQSHLDTLIAEHNNDGGDDASGIRSREDGGHTEPAKVRSLCRFPQGSSTNCLVKAP